MIHISYLNTITDAESLHKRRCSKGSALRHAQNKLGTRLGTLATWIVQVLQYLNVALLLALRGHLHVVLQAHVSHCDVFVRV